MTEIKSPVGSQDGVSRSRDRVFVDADPRREVPRHEVVAAARVLEVSGLMHFSAQYPLKPLLWLDVLYVHRYEVSQNTTGRTSQGLRA